MSAGLLDIGLKELESPVLSGWRDQGRLALKRVGLPTLKTEDWKYTDIRPLLKNKYIAPKTKTRHEGETCVCHEQILPFETYEIHFHNGCLCHHRPHLPEGIELMSLEEAALEHETSAYLNKSFDMEKLPFAALNTAHLGQGVFVRVAKGVSLDKPLAFVYQADSDEPFWADVRNIVVLENGVRLDWIELFESAQANMNAHNVVNEVYIGKSAALRHFKRQAEGTSVAHIELCAVLARQNAYFESFVLQKGAILARHETLINLKEEGARAVLNAAYHPKLKTLHDLTFNVVHNAPKTFSEQLVKGVVEDEAHGVFQGKIRVEPNAIGTEGKQLHKALMFSENAVVDAKPSLEIFADDVKCLHGSATGALDENQLFYMRSRGISETDAKRLLTEAFLNEPFQNIDSSQIRDWLSADISGPESK